MSPSAGYTQKLFYYCVLEGVHILYQLPAPVLEKLVSTLVLGRCLTSSQHCFRVSTCKYHMAKIQRGRKENTRTIRVSRLCPEANKNQWFCERDITLYGRETNKRCTNPKQNLKIQNRAWISSRLLSRPLLTDVSLRTWFIITTLTMPRPHCTR